MSSEKFIVQSIEQVMSESYGKYAKYIIQDRALPDVRDGLKPVQRRIIYAMNELRLFHNLPHKKSARTVGEVIGKYHPHGDSSIYEAMVRMAQDWKNNAPIIDMQGNKGSIDGDNAAAMRYTEARLSKYGEMLISNIKKDCVTFALNFDDSESEPTVLPSLLPNLLVNGSTGIASGYATNIPPFNPVELCNLIIATIDTPGITSKRILDILPGPDFPTGGIISDISGIADAYATGKGRISIISTIEQQGKNKLIIKDIPFETNKADIIRQIEATFDKHDSLGVNEVRDESDSDGISIVIETKNNVNFEVIKNLLYKNTKLKTYYSFNMISICNRKPCLLSMKSIIEAFLNHADEIILKTSSFDLKKCTLRQEIVKGLIKAITIIDEVVRIIRRSSNKADGKEKLKYNFGFTEVQAEAIINLRLYKLSNSDIEALRVENNELTKEILRLTDLCEHKESRMLFLKSYLRDFKKVFPCERKSVISQIETKFELNENDLVPSEEKVVVVSKDGYMWSFKPKVFDEINIDDLKIKDSDLIIKELNTNTKKHVVLFLDDGSTLILPVHKISATKVKDSGSHISSFGNISSTSAKVVDTIAVDIHKVEGEVVVATSSGLVKRVEIKSLINEKGVKGKKYANVKAEEFVTSVSFVDNKNYVCVITKQSFFNAYPINDIPLISNTAAGVKAIKLKTGDGLISVTTFNEDDIILVTVGKKVKHMKISDIKIGGRGAIGKQIFDMYKFPHGVTNLKTITKRNGIFLLLKDGSKIKLVYKDIPHVKHEARNLNSLIKDDICHVAILDRPLVESLDTKEEHENQEEQLDLWKK